MSLAPTSNTSIYSVPETVNVQMLLFLEINELRGPIPLVNQQFKKLASEESLWKNITIQMTKNVCIGSYDWAIEEREKCQNWK